MGGIIIRKVELTMDEQKKYEVIKMLAEHPDGNKDRAALTLGCTRRHINRMLAGYRAQGKVFFIHGNKGCKPAHTVPDDIKADTIKDRNDAIAREEDAFSEAYVKEFHRKVDEYLENGWYENASDPGNYGASWEQTLLNRISKYRRPYFLWVEDFSLPTTNNLSLCELSHNSVSEG